jgi:hypothetical protein
MARMRMPRYVPELLERKVSPSAGIPMPSAEVYLGAGDTPIDPPTRPLPDPPPDLPPWFPPGPAGPG